MKKLEILIDFNYPPMICESMLIVFADHTGCIEGTIILYLFYCFHNSVVF